MNIYDYMRSLSKECIFAADFSAYCDDTRSLYDAIDYIAEDNISIFNDSLINYAMTNADAVYDAAIENYIMPIKEFLVSKAFGSDFTSYVAYVGSVAWERSIKVEIYNAINTCVAYAYTEYLIERDIHEIDDNCIEMLSSIDIDMNYTLGDIMDVIDEELGKHNG